MAGVKHDLEQLVRAARKKSTTRRPKPKAVKIDSRTVIVVDEAGTVNLRQFQKLATLAEKHGATILFVGDPNQLPPVEGSAPFLSISTRHGYAELTKIMPAG